MTIVCIVIYVHIIITLLEKGAYGASVSGNGHAIAAVTKKENECG